MSEEMRKFTQPIFCRYCTYDGYTWRNPNDSYDKIQVLEIVCPRCSQYGGIDFGNRIAELGSAFRQSKEKMNRTDWENVMMDIYDDKNLRRWFP